MKARGNGFGGSRRVCGSLLALFLVCVIVAGTPGVAGAQGWGRLKQVDKFLEKIGKHMQKQSDLRFADLGEALWAAASITKMRGLGIINGYDGNVFQPNKPVTQAEALAMMVRAFDLEDEAEELADRFGLSYAALDREEDDGKRGKSDRRNDKDDGDDDSPAFVLGGVLFPRVPVPARWALGYVLLAVDQGWVRLSECDPHKPATRAWVSKVMVRALGHEAEAEAKMNAILPFVDAASVPKDSIGYVAESVAMGLFQGYTDQTFQPMRPVTRAEMATILERFLGDELPQDIPYVAVGTVQSISGRVIALKTATGRDISYTVSADALILVDRKTATLGEIKVGDLVEVISNGSGAALVVTVKKRGCKIPVGNEVTGDIVGIATPAALTLKIEGQANRTIPVAASCTITMGTTSLAYSDLLLGDRVKVTLQDNQALAIAVLSRGNIGQTVSGVIYGVTSSSAGTDILLQNNAGRITVRLAENVQVTYGNSTLGSGDLRVGDEVLVTMLSQVAVTVKVIARDVDVEFGNMGGSVVSITQTASETVLLVESQGVRTTVKVTSQTVVRHGTTTLTRTDLRLGDIIRVNLQGDTALEIRVIVRGS